MKKIDILSILRCGLLVALCTVPLAAADHHTPVELGVKSPGAGVSAIATPPGTPLTGDVTSLGGWPWVKETLLKYTATVPYSYAGTHTSTFAGTYAVPGGSGGSALTWDMTAKATVPELKHKTIKPAADGTTPSTRTTVGVCESVKFWLEPSPGAVSWTASSGAPATSANQEFTWTADVTPGQSVIQATSGSATWTVTITIIKPASISAANNYDFTTGGTVFDGTAGEIPAGWAGAGMFLQLTLLPTNVCFGNLNWREGAAPMSGQSGYFIGQSMPHPASPVAGGYEVADDNDNLDDTAAFAIQPPLSPGSFTWSIPQRYLKRGTTDEHEIYTVDQVCTTAQNLSSTVSKFGVTSAARSP